MSNAISTMRKIYFCLLLLSSSHLFSQTKLSDVQKYKQAGLVWGLLKYHHPEISKGNYDWDLEFIKLFDKVEGVEDQEELNDLLLGFISKYKKSKLKLMRTNSERLFIKNADYSWIEPIVFGEKLTHELLKIKENGNINNYYASVGKIAKFLEFKGEKGFKDFNYSIKSHRVLLLYSFWNAIQYWDVNKYLMDEKWANCLDSMTQAFINCNTNLEFEITKTALISKLNDSHSSYYHPIFDVSFKYKPVFVVKAVNDTLLVTAIYSQTLARKDDLELGDMIIKINSKSISTSINEKLVPFVSTSNPTLLKVWSNILLYNDTDSINVTLVKKNGTQTNRDIHLYDKYEEELPTYLLNSKDKFSFIKPDIAYVNLEQIAKKDLSQIFKQIANTNGLILDLRNYPKNVSGIDLAEYLYPERKEYIKVLFPMSNSPSYGEYDGESPLKLISDPFSAGSHNPDYYKGKVVLLVNRRTMSRGEIIGMGIQQAPNCITIGEQTGGAVMNIVTYMLPDKTEVNFTGLGTFYPNGEEVQRKELHIDYYVKETAKNYDPELYIKEAVKMIEK